MSNVKSTGGSWAVFISAIAAVTPRLISRKSDKQLLDILPFPRRSAANETPRRTVVSTFHFIVRAMLARTRLRSHEGLDCTELLT